MVAYACGGAPATHPAGTSLSGTPARGLPASATASPGGPVSTPDPDRFKTVRGPMSQADAFSIGNAAATDGGGAFNAFALVLASREVYVFSGPAPTEWIDDETLLAPFYARTADRGYHLLRLDGTDTIVNEPPPAPGAPPYPPPLNSADGRWRLVNGDAAAYIEEAASGRRISIRALGAYPTYGWSPRGHVLAIGAGRCGNVPLSFVDPDAAVPVREVDLGGVTPRGYVWRPDGSGVALATAGGIVFVRADDLSVTRLAPVAPATITYEPILTAWNPSGTHLLFSFSYGRPCPS